MQKTCLTLLFSAALATQSVADTLVQWNFNSVPPDAATTTGSTVPSAGAGTLAVVGGVTNGFSSASAGSASSDPTTTDDTALHTGNYGAQGGGNKTRGVQFNVSTVGFESIRVTWDQRQSPTTSKYFRFQYSTDGVNFVDRDVFTADAPDTFFNNRTVDLNSIIGVNNNANFAFRLVTEFVSTATGSGLNEYVGTSSGYTGAGTVRFDMITVSGTPADPNNFPTITPIPNQVVRVDTATPELPFVIGDVETPAAALIVTGSSSNPTLVPAENITFGGSESNRTVLVAPNFDEVGTATITIVVTDEGGKTASTAFLLTVLPNNTAPRLSALTNLHTVANVPFAPINFTISDDESPGSELTVAVSSANQAVIPDANLLVGGTGADRMLSITPASDQTGNAVITVTVSDDGGLTASRQFNAMVVPSSSVVLIEPFTYPDGPLTTGSGGLWTTRAGTPNQMRVAAGAVQVTSTETEDTLARLIGAPYQTNSSAVLYASFEVTFSFLPRITPDIFAHFGGVDVNDLRARVLASTTNAAPGFFRLGVANTTSAAANVVDYPLDLGLETLYFVVVSYDVRTGISRLWVNPSAGGSWVTAVDPVGPRPINSYAWRQSDGIGTMRIDNVLVGLSFETVTPNLMHLKIVQNGTDVEISWPLAATAEGYEFQNTLGLNPPNWQRAPYTPNVSDDRNIVSITNPADNEFFRLRK